MPENLTRKNIAIFSLTIVVLGGLAFGLQNLLTKSSSEAIPQNVLISDVKSGTVNVSWITAGRTDTKLLYGTTPALGSEATTPGLAFAHLVTLENLLPNTTYFFAVGDGGQKYTQDGLTGEVPYTFRTLALVENKPVAIERQPVVAAAEDIKQPSSAFGSLVKSAPVATSRVLAEATTGGNVGTGTTASGGTPNGATTWPTILLGAMTILFITLGLKLLKN